MLLIGLFVMSSFGFAIPDDGHGDPIVVIDQVDHPVMVAMDGDDINVATIVIPDSGTTAKIQRIHHAKTNPVVDARSYPDHDVGWTDQPEQRIDEPPQSNRKNGTSGGNPGWR